MVADAPRSTRILWPRWQRTLHWGLGAAVVTALVTHHGGPVHEAAGWVALAGAVLRIGLGFVGPAPARFTAFVLGPGSTWAYLRQVRSGVAPRYLNHNPAGGWMVVVLLLAAASAGASGGLYVTDRFWGEAWLIGLHAALAWPLAGLVPLHLGGVVHASLVHRENLVAAMWHGRKPLRAGDR